MKIAKQFPIVGIILAIVSFGVLLLAGTDLGLAIAVSLMWIGSLVLATSNPPDTARKKPSRPFTSDNIRSLIERATTPMLVIEQNRITTANRTARDILGKHIINQDARLVLRQPEAVALLANKRKASTIVRGLVRRRDIWQINRQALSKSLTIIELINKTAEADISRAHTDFVANASHELRTPLAGIIGYVETLSEDPETIDTATAQKFLETIRREANRMQSLVSDLMSLSRIEAEKHDEPVKKVDLMHLVERAARDAAGHAHLDQLQLFLMPDLIIRGDEQQIEQLVRNLVENAFRYGADNAPVNVELVKGREDHARLTVTDIGDGISEQHIPHLTRRFYRTDPGRSRGSGGTGLGLAIVKHIVERHRGRLDIASELGKGTSITVRIPLSQTEASIDNTSTDDMALASDKDGKQ